MEMYPEIEINRESRSDGMVQLSLKTTIRKQIDGVWKLRKIQLVALYEQYNESMCNDLDYQRFIIYAHLILNSPEKDHETSWIEDKYQIAESTRIENIYSKIYGS